MKLANALRSLKRVRRGAQVLGLASAAILSALFAGPQAMAQTYPSQTLKVVVPSTPGVMPDIVARLITQRLGDLWKVPTVVENRPGAGGTIGAAAVAKAPADGYTLLFADSAIWGIDPYVYSKLPYDAIKDLAPVGQVALGIAYVVVSPSVPARTMQEFIAYAKENPGKVTYSSPGVGSSSHLMSESLSKLTGIQMLHAPYKGAEAINAVLSGDVQMTIFSPAAVEAFVKSGKLRMLATSAAQRSEAYPNIPTIAESVAPQFDLVPHFGVLVPAGTPPAVIAKINAGLNTVMADPTLAPYFFRFGLLRVPDATPARFEAAIKSDYVKYGKLIKELNIKLE